MNPEELKQRTKLFGLRIIKLVAALPRTVIGREIGRQLLKAGTSVGANYRAVCRARSRAEFVAKIGVVEEEADESAYWIEMLAAAGIMPLKRLDSLLQEPNELVAIMASSRISASARRSCRKVVPLNRQSAIGNRQ